ncbi:UNVERIFIED_CONTAM: hypothetical protein GTU68_011073 [Idotea baltica]|nr:hypothetical protein [Idotea baltica]
MHTTTAFWRQKVNRSKRGSLLRERAVTQRVSRGCILKSAKMVNQ